MKKVLFKGFWPGFDPSQHSAFNWVFDKLGISIISEGTPDIIVYGTWGSPDSIGDKICKVSFTGERTVPNMDIYDFAFSFENLENKRHFRFPLYLWNHDSYFSLDNRKQQDWAKGKGKFCNFLYGNNNQNLDGVAARNKFFSLLSQYKGVDSGGGVLNNMGIRVQDKIKFLQDYKFTIAFENQVSDGYVTEKIIDPFISGSLPIYRGSPNVFQDFNQGSFINALDFPDLESLVHRIIEIDKDDELYNHIMNSRILPDPVPDWATREWYISCWENIINFSK